MLAGFLQNSPIYGEIETNIERAFNVLRLHNFDLVVLPELFATGYAHKDKNAAFKLAETVPDGVTTEKLIEFAKEKNCHIVAGVLEKDGDDLFNSAIVVGPEGFVGKHRKLNFPQGEEKIYTRGDSLEVFDIGGVTIGIVICFEAWFPEASRILARKGAQIICHPGNYGGPWSTKIIRTRAIENMVYTITANRTGAEQNGDERINFRGESQIIDYMGNPLIRADETPGCAFDFIDPKETGKMPNWMCSPDYDELQIYKKLLKEI